MTYLELAKILAALPVTLLNEEVEARVDGMDGFKINEIVITSDEEGTHDLNKMKVILDF